MVQKMKGMNNRFFDLILRMALTGILVGAMTGCEKKYRYVKVDQNATKALKAYPELSERFKSYWEAMSEKNYKETFSYELPYMNFIHDKTWYLDFKEGSRKHFKVTLLEIVPVGEKSVVVKARFKVKKSVYTVSDKWYKVNGTWYHQYYDSILPPKR